MESDIRIPPVTLNPRKTYILPTRYGYLFIILLLIMLIGSVNYNNNLGFLLTFLLGSICVISLYYTNSNIKGICIVSVQAEPVFAGDPALFEMMVQVSRPDRPAVCFHFSGQPDVTPETLIAGEDNRIGRSKITGGRGIFQPGDVTISTAYPFGIFRAWSTVSMDLKCYVYPRPILHSGDFQTGHSRHEGDTTPFTSGAEDFQGLAEYQPGDSLNRVSWKKVSAGQGLFTKKFDGLTGSAIVIDWYSLAAQHMETRLSIMSGMILKAHQVNLSYGIRLPGITVEPDSGNRHRHRCLQHLAVFSETIP